MHFNIKRFHKKFHKKLKFIKNFLMIVKATHSRKEREIERAVSILTTKLEDVHSIKIPDFVPASTLSPKKKEMGEYFGIDLQSLITFNSKKQIKWKVCFSFFSILSIQNRRYKIVYVAVSWFTYSLLNKCFNI